MNSLSDVNAFVAGIFLASTEGREPMTVEDAAQNLREWKSEQWDDIPEDLTPELLSSLWNDCLNHERSC